MLIIRALSRWMYSARAGQGGDPGARVFHKLCAQGGAAPAAPYDPGGLRQSSRPYRAPTQA